MSTIEQIVEASKGKAVEYVVCQFDGVKLLLTRKKLQSIIETTHEFTKDESVRGLAEKMGVKLRNSNHAIN